MTVAARLATNAVLERLCRPRRVLVVFLRLLVVLAAFGLSGLAPAVTEMVARNTGCLDGCDASGCSDCPLDGAGRDCPPCCPSCHGAHAGVGLPPVAELLLGRLNLQLEAAAVPYEAAVPRAPPVTGVYRPPRGFVTFS